MGSVLSGGQTCSTQAEQHHAGSASGAPTSCGGPNNPPPPPIKVNTAVTESQSSGSTFDTSLQRTQQMGISPLHL